MDKLKVISLVWNFFKGYRTVGFNILAFIALNATDISAVLGTLTHLDPTLISSLILTISNIFLRTQTTTPVFTSDTSLSAADPKVKNTGDTLK